MSISKLNLLRYMYYMHNYRADINVSKQVEFTLQLLYMHNYTADINVNTKVEFTLHVLYA